eukprot:scaffold409354_cov13-Prasinocladus_malaysianus.AAC.1
MFILILLARLEAIISPVELRDNGLLDIVPFFQHPASPTNPAGLGAAQVAAIDEMLKGVAWASAE